MSMLRTPQFVWWTHSATQACPWSFLLVCAKSYALTNRMVWKKRFQEPGMSKLTRPAVTAPYTCDALDLSEPPKAIKIVQIGQK
eukprot:2077183-Amphidinium_carterae.1